MIREPSKAKAVAELPLQEHAEELLHVTDAAAAARKRIESDGLQKPLEALRDACEEINRSWSGSNFGYHATVYFTGLKPPPSHVQFSPEWGLMDRYTSRPNPGWCTMSDEEVIEEIYNRAGRPGKGWITAELTSLRSNFEQLQETAASILTSVLSETKDAFLDRKLKEVQELAAPEPHTIERSLISKGAGWSRDTLALTQGFRAAPHQTVIAFYLSGSVLTRGIDRLEKLTREAASHLFRIQRRSRKNSLVGTNVFIGHGRSPIWRELKDFLEERLGLPVDEFNSVPVAGIATTARLAELLEAAAFAFLVMTGEDEQLDGKARARENVVHEVGLFQGHLGFEKAIVLLEDGCEEFSNIHGLGQIRFPKGNLAAKFEDIRAVLEREGLIAPLVGH